MLPTKIVWTPVLLVCGSLSLIGCGTNEIASNSTVTSTEVIAYAPPQDVEGTNSPVFGKLVPYWRSGASLQEIRDVWDGEGQRAVERADRELQDHPDLPIRDKFWLMWTKATVLTYEGDPGKAYQVLKEARTLVESDPVVAQELLYTLIYQQGVTALRLGENENCIMCRGESSCILPISPAAVHTKPQGSRLAVRHFTEILDKFPKESEVRWLLNLAHMTLGEHPDQVDRSQLIPLGRYLKNEFNIGKFRDIGHLVGVNQFTQAGGAIMDDFDNDGLLDIVITTTDACGQMQFLKNSGTGTFEDVTEKSGLVGQFGGLNCVQTDYNNDGWLDIFVIRGAWVPHPVRPSLLRNNRDGTFTDVTEEAGLAEPVNSIASVWGDYDNDGWLDLFVCCERQYSRLYHSLKDGTFEEVALNAGVMSAGTKGCKGAAWIDYDNDGYLDLFQNFYVPNMGARLLHNMRDGTFRDVSVTQGINGPPEGFSCWAWDYNNDGWLDLFATCYDRTLKDVVKGMFGERHSLNSNRLYLNQQGRGFRDTTAEAGLDMVFATMGSNFGDFDNDGFLDMYLGTGDPNLATLIPNRMFKNVGGVRFADITASSGTGHLQKGHGVACGDWDRDGNVDIFIEMGGPLNGDRYHNILFQNPGHTNHWLTVKLTGEKTNRAAIGARIKVVMDTERETTFYRHVTSGSSFGANPLQQTIGLGKTDRIKLLEIHWPTSNSTQTFRDVAVDQSIAVTEFAENYQRLDWKPITVPGRDTTEKMAGP